MLSLDRPGTVRPACRRPARRARRADRRSRQRRPQRREPRLRDEPAASADARRITARGVGLHLQLRRRAGGRRSLVAGHRRRRGGGRRSSPPRRPRRCTGRRAARALSCTRASDATVCLSSRPTRWCASRPPAIGRSSASISRPAPAWCSWTGCRRAGTRRASDGRSTSIVARFGRAGREAVSCTTRSRCVPTDGDLADRLGRFDVLATVLVLGAPVARPGRSRCCRASRRSADRPARRSQLAGRDAGRRRGCLVASPARRSNDVGRTLREYLGFVPALLGDDPWARKW